MTLTYEQLTLDERVAYHQATKDVPSDTAAGFIARSAVLACLDQMRACRALESLGKPPMAVVEIRPSDLVMVHADSGYLASDQLSTLGKAVEAWLRSGQPGCPLTLASSISVTIVRRT